MYNKISDYVWCTNYYFDPIKYSILVLNIFAKLKCPKRETADGKYEAHLLYTNFDTIMNLCDLRIGDGGISLHVFFSQFYRFWHGIYICVKGLNDGEREFTSLCAE